MSYCRRCGSDQRQGGSTVILEGVPKAQGAKVGMFSLLKKKDSGS